jgi:hypothetical protein
MSTDPGAVEPDRDYKTRVGARSLARPTARTVASLFIGVYPRSSVVKFRSLVLT